VSDDWLAEYRVRAAYEHSDIGHYLPVLFGTAARYPQPKIIELGLHEGDSTTALLAAAQWCGGHVWSVDVSPDCRFLKHEPDPRLWTFVSGDSRSVLAVQGTPDDAHVVLIDSSHEYDQTKDELRIYLPKLRAGGTLLMHDIDNPDCGPAVRAALTEVLPEFGLSMTAYGGVNGLGVITIPPRWH
jgi:predicted O-methyltransferase YrrM